MSSVNNKKFHSRPSTPAKVARRSASTRAPSTPKSPKKNKNILEKTAGAGVAVVAAPFRIAGGVLRFVTRTGGKKKQ